MHGVFDDHRRQGEERVLGVQPRALPQRAFRPRDCRAAAAHERRVRHRSRPRFRRADRPLCPEPEHRESLDGHRGQPLRRRRSGCRARDRPCDAEQGGLWPLPRAHGARAGREFRLAARHAARAHRHPARHLRPHGEPRHGLLCRHGRRRALRRIVPLLARHAARGAGRLPPRGGDAPRRGRDRGGRAARGQKGPLRRGAHLSRVAAYLVYFLRFLLYVLSVFGKRDRR